jgi:histone deacetylase 6
MVETREATNEELCSVHTQNHVELMKAISSKSYGKHQRKALASCYDSIFFNNSSSRSALLAAGSVIEVVIHPCVFFICWALLFTFIKAFYCYTVLEFGDIALKITLFMCK